MRAFSAHVRSTMEVANARGVARAPNGSCVAMHIRRTDKHSEDHRTQARGFQDFSQMYKSWAYWSYQGMPAQLSVFLGSEDKQSFRESAARAGSNPFCCPFLPPIAAH